MAWNEQQPDFGVGYQPSKSFTTDQGWQSARSGGWEVGSEPWQSYQRSFNPDELSRFSTYKAQQEAKYKSPYAVASRMAGSTSNMLSDLISDPSKIQQTAGYQFAKGQGEQAINRSAAAKGMLGSGNVLAELQKYGTGLASQEYGSEVNRLADLLRGSQQFLLGASAGPYQYGALNPYSGGSAWRPSTQFA